MLKIQLFGGRGASSGISDKGKKYGTEYRTVYKYQNIKFLKYNDSSNAKAPLETMSKSRIYVTLDNQNQLKYITFYDREFKKYKQIDLIGVPHKVNGEFIVPHTHYGYIHDENGTKKPTSKEKNIIDNVYKIWENKLSK